MHPFLPPDPPPLSRLFPSPPSLPPYIDAPKDLVRVNHLIIINLGWWPNDTAGLATPGILCAMVELLHGSLD